AHSLHARLSEIRKPLLNPSFQKSNSNNFLEMFSFCIHTSSEQEVNKAVIDAPFGVWNKEDDRYGNGRHFGNGPQEKRRSSEGA
ncbi:MAG: hypothetical protein AAFU69_12475, partial [Pseudomonadota bacterium]